MDRDICLRTGEPEGSSAAYDCDLCSASGLGIRRRSATVRSARLLAGVLVPVALLALSGCDAGVAPRSPVRCIPQIVVNPPELSPGDLLVVTGRAVECELDFTDDRWFELDLSTVGGGGVALATQRVHAGPKGEFSAELRVPPDMPLGEAYVRVASGYDGGPCDDTGACADASSGFHVIAPAPATT